MTVLTDTQVVTASGGLVELGYVERTTSQSVTATTFAGASEVFATDLTYVADGSPVVVEFYAPQVAVGGTYIVMNLSNGSTGDLGQIAYAASSGTAKTEYRYTPSAGVQTLNVRAWVQSGTGTLSGGAGGSGQFPPILLRVSKIVQATQWPAVTTGSIICTSSTRPASPFAGQQIYETDTLLPYTYNGTIWTSSLPAFLSAAGTDVTTGPPSGNLIYTFATVTLTPGTWLVTAGMSLINTVTSDDAAVALYNRTTSAEVASSRGATGSTQTAFEHSLVSRQVSMTVTANTQVCPYGTRNGGSTIKPVNSSGGTPGYIQATRISIP